MVSARKKSTVLSEQYPLEMCSSLKDELVRLRGDISDPEKENKQS